MTHLAAGMPDFSHKTASMLHIVCRACEGQRHEVDFKLLAERRDDAAVSLAQDGQIVLGVDQPIS